MVSLGNRWRDMALFEKSPECTMLEIPIMDESLERKMTDAIRNRIEISASAFASMMQEILNPGSPKIKAMKRRIAPTFEDELRNSLLADVASECYARADMLDPSRHIRTEIAAIAA